MIALGAYEILEHALVVHIVYLEAQPESNPTLDEGRPKYTGIGRMMIAYGIKLSIDNGFAGDVVLEAQTTELAGTMSGILARCSFRRSSRPPPDI